MSQCKECEEINGYHLIGCTERTKHLKREGNLFERTRTLPREKAFSDIWKKWNTPQYGVNGGYTAIENIILPEAYPNKGPGDPFRSLKGEVTERDDFVAASIIQWLGTNCGQGFLDEVKNEINRKKTSGE